MIFLDIGNTYLNAKYREQVHVHCGMELFGQEHMFGNW